jgi:arginine decarboxylase
MSAGHRCKRPLRHNGVPDRHGLSDQSHRQETVNQLKGKLKTRQGPVEKDQARSPFADAIRRYWEEDILAFSIPAHSGGRGPAPEFTKWAGLQTARADLPTSHGLDTRDRVFQVQATAQELFAEATGAKQSLFSTNGSSLSAHVAIMSVVGPGETLLMARNGHKSAFAGLVLSGARPIYIEPYYDEDLEVAHGVLVEDAVKALDQHPEAKAMMIFTPSYYGTSADVKAIAEACHDRGLPLVTDDAWALDYAISGHPDLPEGALAQGSDLAIGSVHKTLTGLTQTSVLSVGSDRIDAERLQLCFELEESTSTSGLLLSSIDGARVQFMREGEELLSRALASAHRLRDRMASEVPELPVVTLERLKSTPGATGVDPMHVLIETAPIGLTGYEALDWLRFERHIETELVDHRRIMPLISFAHGEPEIDRLVRALRDLVDENPDRKADDLPQYPSRPQIRSDAPMLPRDAFFAPSELVKFKEAVGRVSAELVTPYPPGIPAVAPGELYTEENIAYLQQFVEIGGYVEGAADPELQKLRVVAE